MRMHGELFWSLGTDPKAIVQEAVITSRRISIDWNENNVQWHLEAASRDGENYSGNYGYSGENPDYEFKLTLFRNKSEHLLVGTWHEHDSGNEGTWHFRLKAETSLPPSRRTKKPRS